MTYFGLCDSSGNPSFSGSDNSEETSYYWNLGTESSYTCPGSGNQTVKELSGDTHIGSGTPNLRLAIYSADGATLIAQGTGEVAISGASDTWQGHMTQASIDPNPCTLTGGVKYILVFGTDGDAATTHCDTTGDYGKYALADKTGGYSGSLPAGTAGFLYPVRCGVDAASTSLSIWASECVGSGAKLV